MDLVLLKHCEKLGNDAINKLLHFATGIYVHTNTL